MKKLEKFFAAIIYLIPIVLSAQNLQILIKTDSLAQTESYTCKVASGEFSLEVYLNDLNKGIIRYRYTGNHSLKEQLPVLKELLATVLKKNQQTKFHTFAWGRLNDTHNKDYTMAVRLAKAAFQSQLWNSQTGKSVNGNINFFVKNTARQMNIFAELKELFSPFGFSVDIASVEKVLVLPADKLPFSDSLPDDIPKKARLPFDCQLWFSLTANR
ncbi:MAG: hypothetical protein H6627_13335 [Calditrichae bacterium]|nr:hypothetical protein [Calditrichia bacterium]